MVEPDLACAADGDVSVTITGTGFRNVDGRAAGLSFGMMSLPAKPGACTPLPGPRETVNVCTTLTFLIPKNTAGGSFTVAVQNPDPAGCASASKPFALFDRPVVSSVRPTAIFSQAAQAMLTLTGNSFGTVRNTPPAAKI